VVLEVGNVDKGLEADATHWGWGRCWAVTERRDVGGGADEVWG